MNHSEILVEEKDISHSATVQMQLLVNGSAIGVAQMGPDFLFIETASDHPPGDATLILKVDGNEQRWRVKLPKGIFSDSVRVEIAAWD